MSDGRTTMDFFESQHSALKRTTMLLFFFAMAVILIILAVHLVVCVILLSQFGETFWSWVANPRILMWTVGGTSLLIAGGTIGKIIELRDGGSAVAIMLGGTPVDPGTTDPNSRKLLNVVEEMAIASGAPVPDVYIMQREKGINAFAAGFSLNDAAIGVTRGAVEILSRDELQGVIAHEFSHIVNGDMRLNIRLIGVLSGIVLIGALGMGIIRGMFDGAVIAGAGMSRRRSSNDRGGGGAILLILALAVALIIIGYIGTFFANAIKSAVSRQREYLADAAAIQYTRNAEGLSGALQKIGGLGTHGKIKNRHAEEASHMFFDTAVKSYDLWATHPPLPKRIKAILPRWDGTFPKIKPIEDESISHGSTKKGMSNEEVRKAFESNEQDMIWAAVAASNAINKSPQSASASPALPGQETFDPEKSVRSIGTISDRTLEYTKGMLDSIPTELKDKAHQRTEVTALVFALLMHGDEKGLDKERQYIRKMTTEKLSQKVDQSLELLADQDIRVRMPLVGLAIPTLRSLSTNEKKGFLTVLDGLIESDGKVHTFEFAIRRIVTMGINSEPTPTPQLYSINSLWRECSLIVSAVVHSGADRAGSASLAFERSRARLKVLGENLKLLPEDQLSMEAVEEALERLILASPAIKRSVIEAMAAAILADQKVTIGEYELLRAVSVSLECPMPPVAG